MSGIMGQVYNYEVNNVGMVHNERTHSFSYVFIGAFQHITLTMFRQQLK